jgi:transposase
VHDLPEAEKHCGCCGKDLRPFDEEISERYEYIFASIKVIDDVLRNYARDCTVKAAAKPAQPIEKSTAGASMLAHVIVSKFADHQPLHRQEKMFERQGVRISRKTMGGWLAQVGSLLDPLYESSKKVLFESKVLGTDDTGVKVLDAKLPFARTGRIWPYLGNAHHPVVVHHYTRTRGRDGPAKFLEGYKGYLQADVYSVYDAFFKPARGLTEVGCMMHMRRYFYKALDSDQERMGKALQLIAKLYRIEDRAKGLSTEERPGLRQRLSAPVMAKLNAYLLRIREEVLPKSPGARAVRYALNQWSALTRFLEDGDLQIDNGATARVNRDIALGRANWTFFGSDEGGKTAARVDELHRQLEALQSRAVRLAPRRALPCRISSRESARRTAPAQLETIRPGNPGLISDQRTRPPLAAQAVYQPLTLAVHQRGQTCSRHRPESAVGSDP